MSDVHSRIAREIKTIAAMLRIYCRGEHGNRDPLCAQCSELLEYARHRLDKCPYQEGKTTCVKCPIHCYKPENREAIRDVMRYAGPRFPRRHPILALYHVLDGRRDTPFRPGKEVPADGARKLKP